jgi:hypothetical protein
MQRFKTLLESAYTADPVDAGRAQALTCIVARLDLFGRGSTASKDAWATFERTLAWCDSRGGSKSISLLRARRMIWHDYLRLSLEHHLQNAAVGGAGHLRELAERAAALYPGEAWIMSLMGNAGRLMGKTRRVLDKMVSRYSYSLLAGFADRNIAAVIVCNIRTKLLLITLAGTDSLDLQQSESVTLDVRGLV